MDPAQPKPRTYTLHRAGAIVFALAAILPLLLLSYTLYELGALGKPRAQVGLGLALGGVLIGAYIFWGMMTRMAEILRASVRFPEASPGPETPAPPEAGFDLPGLGTIREAEPIRESDMLQGTVDQLRAMWQAEAEPLVGRRVSVSVRNAPEPVMGTLSQITGDGLLLLDDDGKKMGISYRRISAIEAERAASSR